MTGRLLIALALLGAGCVDLPGDSDEAFIALSFAGFSASEVPEVPADSASSIDLVVSFPRGVSSNKTFTISTSVGEIDRSADNAAARKTIELATSGESDLVVPIHATTEVGLATVTVQEEGGTAAQASLQFVAVAGALAMQASPGPFPADGQTAVPIALRQVEGSTGTVGASLTTSMGVLNPGASGAAERTRAVTLRGDIPVTINLLAGRTPGVALLSATVVGGNAIDSEIVFELSPPNRMGMSATANVLSLAATASTIVVTFDRDPGTGLVSENIPVGFVTCCDPGSGFGECELFASITSLTTAAGTARSVSETLRLTAAGEALARETQQGPDDQLDIELYAFIYGPNPPATDPTCSEIVASLPSPPPGVAIMDSLPLIIQKQAP